MLQQQLARVAQVSSGPREFGALQVRERVITATGLAISIDNISTVSTWHNRSNGWILTLLLMIAALGAALGSGGPAQLMLLIPPMLLAALTIYLWLKRNRYRLIIATNDGAKFHFSGPDLHLLDEVRDFITRKIDQKDPRLTLNANFEKGSIENLNVDKLYADVVASGTNVNVASRSPGARVGSSEASYSAHNSPGAQVGTGNTSRGSRVAATVTQTIARVDYSSVLPEIERWQRSAAGSQGWEHVAERLSRLEVLLKEGTPTVEQKQSARALAVDLSQVLQGYPAAVQLFQSVIRLIGL